MNSKVRANPALRRAGFHVRIACMFVVLVAAIIIVTVLGMRGRAPAVLVVAVIVLTTGLAWLAVWNEWRAVRQLAKLVGGWDGNSPDVESLDLHFLSRPTDPDVAALAGGLHSLATRISDCAQREHQFTRDVSHELRSPLTVVKMSVDRLLDVPRLSDADTRTVRRIQRASLELETMVEALLVLAREPDGRTGEERFVANDVVRMEVASARELLRGRPIELKFQESARFALEGSARGFGVLCGQLIRNACQQTDEGPVLIALTPDMLSVSNGVAPLITDATRSRQARAVSRHGFELGIAQRISDRFVWPLELQSGDEHSNVARIRFPHWLPPEVATERVSARRA